MKPRSFGEKLKMMIETTVKKSIGAIFQRKMRRPELEYEIRLKELMFRKTNKLENPGQWLQVQAELGELYRELMRFQQSDTKPCKHVRQSAI
jgi:hypothetical protein